jgi:hypothetical protein
VVGCQEEDGGEDDMSWQNILKLQPHGKLRPFRESGNEGNLTAEFSAKLNSLPTTNRERYRELEEGGDFSQGPYKREKVLEFDRLTETEKKHILENDAMFDQFMLDFDDGKPRPTKDDRRASMVIQGKKTPYLV